MNNLYNFFVGLLLLLTSCSSGKEIQYWQTENSALKVRLDSLKAHCNVLESELLKFEETKLQLKKTETALVKFYQKYEGTETGLPINDPLHNEGGGTINYKDLVLQNDSLKTRILELNANLDSLSKNIGIAGKKSSKSNSLKEIEKIRQQKIVAEKENLLLKNKNSELETKTSVLEELKVNLELKNKALQNAMDSALQQWTKFSNETIQNQNSSNPGISEQKYAESLIENEQLQTQNNLLIQKLEYLNRLLADKNANQEQMASTSALENKIKEYENELHDRAQVIKSLNGFIDAKNSEIQSLLERSQSNQNVLDSLNEQNQVLLKQNATHEKNNQSIKAQEQEIENLQQEISTLKQEKLNQNNKLSKLQRDLDLSDTQFRRIQNELALKNNEISDLKKKSTTASRPADRNDEDTRLKDSLEYSRAKVLKLEQIQSRLEIQLDSLQEFRKGLTQRITFLQKQLETSEQENLQFKNKLSGINTAAADVEKINPSTPAVVSRLETPIKEMLSPLNTKKCTSLLKNRTLYIYLSQRILFNQDSYVMNPEGSELINNLAGILKNGKGTTLEISGYSSKNSEDRLSVDAMIRNASTVFKLLSALGWPANKMRLGAKYIENNTNTTIHPHGIELQIRELE
ncbi:MAG: hypothetical protein IPM34_11855 [Saprospiraceae bacterium]|nr:hypothetical protein [Saprospiraceae bacterium]